MILPSVLPATRLRASGGFHRFEPDEWVGIAPAPGNVLTRQGISLEVLHMSPYGSDHNFILTSRMAGVWPLRILVAQQLRPAFPADCPHRSHFHSDRQTRVAPDSRVFQHMASFAPRNCSRGGQSPGKRAWVVTLGPFVDCYSRQRMSGAPAFLWRSSRRREDRTLSSRSQYQDLVWRKVSEDSRGLHPSLSC